MLKRFKDPAMDVLFRKMKDSPIFDALEDEYDRHPHWELQQEWDAQAEQEAEQAPF